jgi:hypothetical protein
MIHDSHIIVVTEPTNNNRFLYDGVAISIKMVYANLVLLFGWCEYPVSSKATATMTNRKDNIHICQEHLNASGVIIYAIWRTVPGEAVYIFHKRRNSWLYTSALHLHIAVCVWKLGLCT